MATWNELLRTARKQRGLTQLALAERGGVSVRNVTTYEGGAISPMRDTLLRLAQGLGLDRPAVNALLGAAGHDLLPTGRLKDFERRRIPLTLMQQEIDRYTWPCLIVSDAVEILLWNQPAIWVGEFDFAAELPSPPDRSLIRITAMDHFQEPRVVNWVEIATALIAMLKADFEDPERYAAAIPWFGTVVQELATQPRYQKGFLRLMELWQTVKPSVDVAEGASRRSGASTMEHA